MGDTNERSKVVAVQQQTVREPRALDGTFNDSNSWRADEGGRPGEWGSHGKSGKPEIGKRENIESAHGGFRCFSVSRFFTFHFSRACTSDQICLAIASSLFVPYITMKRSGMPFASTR